MTESRVQLPWTSVGTQVIGRMRRDESSLCRLSAFRIRWFTRTGLEFQNLFADLMQNAWPGDFQKVKSYGPRGDFKCVGYWMSRQCVFRCYGPASMRGYALIAKIRKDLRGAVNYCPRTMRRWGFVHNDKKGELRRLLVRVRILAPCEAVRADARLPSLGQSGPVSRASVRAVARPGRRVGERPLGRLGLSHELSEHPQ